ncbi:hypothetical protein ENSA7_04950 [Enhygromyxa salina]|uniref:Uncharacterized protein n=1 Tax=Enhygromyxa salina TaxID=215803 RepID=A0A2S9YXC7_9BACT|nr:hypothetical protein ENSA7_04950 [Enhygromyxa salina]
MAKPETQTVHELLGLLGLHALAGQLDDVLARSLWAQARAGPACTQIAGVPQLGSGGASPNSTFGSLARGGLPPPADRVRQPARS